MTDPGGRQFGRPDFSDAIPPNPPRQGTPGPEGMGSNRVDEHTFESGSIPANTGAIESSWMGLIDDDGLDGHSMDFTAMAGGTGVANKGMGEGIRGFRSAPVGGTYNPGQGKGAPAEGTERSNTAY
jgi:hypothetical protein